MAVTKVKELTSLDLTLGPKVMTATHCDPSYVYMYNVDATIS